MKLHLFVFSIMALAYIVARLMMLTEEKKWAIFSHLSQKRVGQPLIYVKSFQLKKIGKMTYEYFLLFLGIPILMLVLYLIGYMLLVNESTADQLEIQMALGFLSVFYLLLVAVFWKYILVNLHRGRKFLPESSQVFLDEHSLFVPVLTLEGWWRDFFDYDEHLFLKIDYAEIKSFEVLELTGIKQIRPAYYKIIINQTDEPIYILRKYFYGLEADFLDSFRTKINIPIISQ